MTRIGSALSVMLLVLAGCGGRDVGQQPSPSSALVGRTFLSTEVTSHTLVSGTRIWLSFPEAGKITARAGCNHLFGTVAFEADRLKVTGMGGTDMGCEKALHEQDEWLTGFLTSGPRLRESGDGRLVLTGEQATITLVDRKVASPDLMLIGTTWRLQSLQSGDTVSSLPAGVQAELVFTGDGKLSGSTGCNQLTGEVKVASNTITFDKIGVTRRACLGEAASVEEAVLAVLQGDVAMKIEEEVLTLSHPGGKGLQLRGEN